MNAYPKSLQGWCIGVLSGDRILFQGPPDRQNGGYRQKLLHLSGIQAPKVDPIAPNKDQKYGYASRQFMRKLLVGKKLKFTVEKKVNQIEIGYVLDEEERDASVLLLREGLARLRGDKIQAKNAEQYLDAEQQAKMAEVGIWNQENDKNAYRNIKTISDSDFVAQFKNQTLKGVAQEVYASKATVFFPKQSIIVNVNYADIQVVVVSQKASNGQSKNNARNIRSIIQTDFLQREVTVNFSESCKADNVCGCITNDSGLDIRKVLLQYGHAKLGKQAISSMPTKDFIQLKGLAQKALQQGKGFWKEQKVTKSQTFNSKQYTAIVYQIHSGDSITVFNPIKKQLVRIFFPNVRAPSNGKPFAFEAKEALRKKCIGRNVQVQVEFMKKITVKKFQGDTGELKNFIFASAIEQNTNLSVFMLQQGLITLQQIRTQEDISKYLQEMKNAEQSAKKQHKGLHSKHDAKLPTYNDISGGKGKKIDTSKSKQLFQFLKDEQYLSATVQLVLNGSRFKIRFHQQHVMAIVVLDGVRCLPNEEQFSKLSEEALNFSKMNALQRDFEIKLRRVDLKGVYHANLISLNKKDYALDLLENGLAVTVVRNKNALYEDIESECRKKKVGIWKNDLNLQAIKGGQIQKLYKPVNFAKNLVLTEVVSAEEFYLESQGCKKPEVPQKPLPATAIKVGEIYLAQFTVDGVYYRARIVRQTRQGFEVFFIDYGNYDVVSKQKIGAIEDSLKKQKSPLYHCSLYGLQSFTKQAINILKDHLGAKIKVEMKQQADDGQYKVILYDLDNKNKNINLDLLEFGQAQNSTSNQVWEKAQENARRNREGKWNDE